MFENFRQKIDEFNMTFGFFLFVGFIITGIILIVFDNLIIGIMFIITALFTLTRQMALLHA